MGQKGETMSDILGGQGCRKGVRGKGPGEGGLAEGGLGLVEGFVWRSSDSRPRNTERLCNSTFFEASLPWWKAESQER